MLSQPVGHGKWRQFWICAVVTPASAPTSRSISLALVSILVVVLRSRAGLLAVAFIMILVQSGDAIIGGIDHEPIKTFGPAFLALMTVAALIPLFRATPINETE
ncbi:MAG: hypothetical protein JWQ98_170 [Chlorobi bacterium]|nr:hypothetical protein [Chlorobiota bacterium]